MPHPFGFARGRPLSRVPRTTQTLPRSPGTLCAAAFHRGAEVTFVSSIAETRCYLRKLTCWISLVNRRLASHTVVLGQLCPVVSSQLSVSVVSGKGARVHLQSFKPDSRRVWPNCSAKSLRMRILTSNPFGWNILQAKFFSRPLLSIFCETGGGRGYPAGDVIYIKYIDVIVHITDLLAIEPLSGPFVAAKPKGVNILPVTHLDGISCDINDG